MIRWDVIVSGFGSSGAVQCGYFQGDVLQLELKILGKEWGNLAKLGRFYLMAAHDAIFEGGKRSARCLVRALCHTE